MLEIEIKAYCDDLHGLEKNIVALGGKYQKKIKEQDIYYKHPSRDFTKTDEAFRIRIEDNIYKVTYKGPKLGDKTKTRIEEETFFTSLGAMKNILEKLGFEVVDEVIKKRTVYELSGCKICLDSVEGVGDFIEIERIGEEREKNERELFALAEKLRLSKFERKSYLELKLEKKTT